MTDEQINRCFGLAHPADTTSMQERRVIARAIAHVVTATERAANPEPYVTAPGIHVPASFLRAGVDQLARDIDAELMKAAAETQS